MPADPRLYDPDPAVRLAAWRELAGNAGITADTCDRLARSGFPEAASGLHTAIGTDNTASRERFNRGRYLGRVESWGLDVYENSPQAWKDALYAETDKDRHAD
jgi:hypothetical protein